VLGAGGRSRGGIRQDRDAVVWMCTWGCVWEWLWRCGGHGQVSVQEYCNGGSLRQAVNQGLFTSARLRRRWQPLMKILMGIAAGMAYVHSKRICHGDLNPSNVLLKVRSSRPCLPEHCCACSWCALRSLQLIGIGWVRPGRHV
jgi:serine/threonine protein kinase